MKEFGRKVKKKRKEGGKGGAWSAGPHEAEEGAVLK